MIFQLPKIKGIIRRRILVNFKAEPEVVQKFLPAPFSPKLHDGHAIVGICLIRLEQVRPVCFPTCLGMSSENAAHRVAVLWKDDQGLQREGVYIPRRDTNSALNRFAGGRVFPGEHHPAEFKVTDINGNIDFRLHSLDGSVDVQLKLKTATQLPGTSCFKSVEEVSQFFEGGSLGYSPKGTHRRLQGLQLKTENWEVKPLEALEVRSSFFEDPSRFPPGSVSYDNTLIMRDLNHEWISASDLNGEM